MMRVVALLLLLAASAQARTFYVDAINGLDTNDGSVCTTPWLNPPGTRNVGNTANVATTWHSTAGADITGADDTHRVQCGDTILLRAPVSYTSTSGGGWCIADTNTIGYSGTHCGTSGTWYYQAGCGAANPIRIKVANTAEWGSSCTGGASTGDFLFNGTGITPVDNSNFPCAGGGGICGMILVTGNVDGLTIQGDPTTGQFLQVVNTPISTDNLAGITLMGGNFVSTDANMLAHIRLTNILVRESGRSGIAFFGIHDSIVKNTTVFHTGRSCFDYALGSQWGMHHVGCEHCRALACDDEVGFGTSGNGGDDAFNANTGHSMWLVDTTAADSYQRGYNLSGHPFGHCSGPTDWHVRFFRAMNNSRGEKTTQNAASGGVYLSGASNMGWWGGYCSVQPVGCGTDPYMCNQDSDCTTANADCRGPKDPHACCTGTLTGTCAAPTGICQCTPNVCNGGTNAGYGCNGAGDCPGGTCTGVPSCSGITGCGAGTQFAHYCQSPYPHAEFFVQGLIYKNLCTGNWIYGTGRFSMWNTTLFGDEWDAGDGCVSAEINWDVSALQHNLFNSIVLPRSYSASSNAWAGPNHSNNPWGEGPLSRSNDYREGKTDASTSTFSGFSCAYPGGAQVCTSSSISYANLSTAGFTDATDAAVTQSQLPFASVYNTSGTHNCDSTPVNTVSGAVGDYGSCAGGYNINGTCFDALDCPGAGGSCTKFCDFTPATGSVAIDAGRAFLVASGAGTNATVITVAANGDSLNPRAYFKDATSYLDSVPDQIQVGATLATVASLQEPTCGGCGTGCINGTVCYYPADCLTGTCGSGTGSQPPQITTTAALSWSTGAMIHVPYSGNAPDRGFLESGLAVATTTTTSTTTTTVSATTTTTLLPVSMVNVWSGGNGPLVAAPTTTTTTTMTSTTTTLPVAGVRVSVSTGIPGPTMAGSHGPLHTD